MLQHAWHVEVGLHRTIGRHRAHLTAARIAVEAESGLDDAFTDSGPVDYWLVYAIMFVLHPGATVRETRCASMAPVATSTTRALASVSSARRRSTAAVRTPPCLRPPFCSFKVYDAEGLRVEPGATIGRGAALILGIPLPQTASDLVDADGGGAWAQRSRVATVEGFLSQAEAQQIRALEPRAFGGSG